ncbi:hypothetical protein BDR06DRAFT_970569 [Suillus hirtellus]|nr:hypothetical protein BDR06DRAFT_970569 [Suillus hirtellus]
MHPSTKQWESMRDWLEHPYKVLAPPLFIQGSFADLDLTLIPHGLVGLRVAKNWICESFYRLNPSKSPQFLTTLMRITSLSFTFNQNDAPTYIVQANQIIATWCWTCSILTEELLPAVYHQEFCFYLLWVELCMLCRCNPMLMNQQVLCGLPILPISHHYFAIFSPSGFAENSALCPAYYQKRMNDVVEHMALLLSRGMPCLDGYLRVIFNTNKASSGLVKLVHKTRQSTQTLLVRQLVYEKTSDIPYLLSSDMVAAQSMLRAEAAAFMPHMQCPKDGVEICPAEKENLNPVLQEADREEVKEKEVSVIVDSEATDDMEDLDKVVTSLTSLDPVLDESIHANGPLEEQLLAAHMIQYAYCYHIWRCSGSAVDAELYVIFTTCLKEMQSSKWCPSIVLTHAAKIKTKVLFNTKSHEKLEELGRQRSKIKLLLKKGMQLREVGQFIQKVPSSMTDMQAKSQMVYKGIIAEKKLFHM